MAAGMRESAEFNPSDVPVFRSLGHWAERGRANEVIRFVHTLSEQSATNAHNTSQQNFREENKG